MSSLIPKDDNSNEVSWKSEKFDYAEMIPLVSCLSRPSLKSFSMFNAITRILLGPDNHLHLDLKSRELLDLPFENQHHPKNFEK